MSRKNRRRHIANVAFLAALFMGMAEMPAHAGPIPGLVSALATAFTASSIAATLVQVAVGLAVSYGLSMLAKTDKPSTSSGVQTQVQIGGDNPLSFIMGWYATAGQLEYVGTWGKAGKTENAYLTMVISLSDLPVHGLRSRIWVGGKPCTIDFDAAETEQGYPVVEYNDKGKDYLWVKFHDGTQTTADSFLVSKFAGDPQVPWKNDAVGTGTAYATVTARTSRKLFSGLPQCRFELEGIPLYDVRKDSTAGGSGTHRWTDPTTWEYSDNPMVMAYNVLRGIYYGTQWIYGLQNLPAARLPFAAWAAAMNECDAPVDDGTGTGGTETQYRAGAEIRVDQQPFDAIEDLLKACAGRLAEIGGIYKPLVNLPGAAVYSFTDEDVVVTDGSNLDPFPGLENTYNGIHASYPEPEEAWSSKDAPPRYSPDLEALDNDNRLMADLTFDVVPYPLQVQRLMVSSLADDRRFIRHQVTLPPEAMLLEPNDMVAWTSTHNGYSAKLFLVTAIDGAPGMNQTLSLMEVDPSDYDWNTANQLPYTTGGFGPTLPAPQVMQGWNAVSAIQYDADGTPRRPAVQVFYDGDLDDRKNVRVQVRLAGDTLVLFDGESPYGDPATNAAEESVLVSFAAILPNTTYEVRGVFVPYSDADMLWSNQTEAGGVVTEGAWISVTTGNYAFGTKDILDGAITELKVAAQAISSAKIKLAAVTNELLAPDSVTNEKIADAALTVSKFAEDLTPVQIVDMLPASGTKVGQTVYNTGDGQLYTWDGATWNTASATVADGSITADKLAEAAVTASKLASGAVTHDAISAGSVYGDVIAAGSITARELVLTDFNNLVPDNQMQLVGSWGVRPPATSEVMWAIQNGATGSWNSRGQFKFIVANKTTGYTGQESDFFPVKPGTKYRAATQVYASDLSKVNNIFRVLWYDINKTLLSYTDWFNGVPTTQFCTSTVTAPSSAAFATAAFYVFEDNTTVDAYYAGVFVAEQNAASLIVDGGITTNLLAANSVTAGIIAAGAITADKLAANSVTAKSVVITDPTNLVPDNQIQDAATWGYAGTGPQSSWFMTANGPPWQSVGIFKYDLTNKTTGYTGRIGKRFPVKGGKQYVISGQAWNNGETAATFNVLIRVDWLDLSEQFIVSSYALNYGGPGSSLPLTNTVTVTAPANAARAQFAYYVNQDTTTATAVWFGGPIVREMNAAELIVDGGIIADMIAAGAVTADKITVSSLEAISATLGNVAVNGAVIMDATIVNAKTGPLRIGRLQ